MKNKKYDIKIFVMPVGACSYEKSWQYAADLVSKKLRDRLGDVFEMKLVEILSPESFSYAKITEGIQYEKLQTPVVMIVDEIVQSGGKLFERNLKEKIEKLIEGKNESGRNT